MKRQAGKHTSAAPGVDRVISNLKTWLRGTHHGVGADHLDAYLDEFAFRFDRRHNRAAEFASLLGLTIEVGHATAAAISPFSETAKRRGRSTGQTGLVHRNRPPLAEGEVTRRRRADRPDISDWLDTGRGRPPSQPPSATRTGRVCAQCRRRPGRARTGRRPEATDWRPQRRWSASGPGGMGIPTRSSDTGR